MYGRRDNRDFPPAGRAAPRDFPKGKGQGISGGEGLPAQGKSRPSRLFYSNLDFISFFFSSFHWIGPLGRFDLVVAMSACWCLSPFHVLDFEAYFAPTSQSQMSKIFRDSESFGKSPGMKWCQNWQSLLGSGFKSLRKKKLVFCWFCLTKHGGN